MIVPAAAACWTCILPYQHDCNAAGTTSDVATQLAPAKMALAAATSFTGLARLTVLAMVPGRAHHLTHLRDLGGQKWVAHRAAGRGKSATLSRNPMPSLDSWCLGVGVSVKRAPGADRMGRLPCYESQERVQGVRKTKVRAAPFCSRAWYSRAAALNRSQVARGGGKLDQPCRSGRERARLNLRAARPCSWPRARSSLPNLQRTAAHQNVNANQ